MAVAELEPFQQRQVAHVQVPGTSYRPDIGFDDPGDPLLQPAGQSFVARPGGLVPKRPPDERGCFRSSAELGVVLPGPLKPG